MAKQPSLAQRCLKFSEAYHRLTAKESALGE